MSQPPDPRPTTADEPRPDSRDRAAREADGVAAAADRLELREEIGRGGMGAVLKGHDSDIGRDVAVKVLLADAGRKPLLARRFLEEARITGRLQHPGIVPVYALGRLADGRPYFAMKLVKGRTLADLLAERADASADRPRMLHVFEQMCQTLAYAHAHGVIHRDLKPSNVMVGAFGEVQVMDWGLAKVLTPEEKAEAPPEATEVVSVIRTPRGKDSDTGEEGSETRAGSVLGTPAYMAPEQARGEIEDVDRRSDVFGLGAVLCDILTGRPPYAGPGEAALKRARRADLADALERLDGCGVDAELIALAKRCLSADPTERPRDAGETAASVTAYRESVAERLRRAEVSQAAEAARAEEAQATAAQERKAKEEAQRRAKAERRARRMTLGLAASVLVLAAAGAGTWLWMQRQWAEQAARTALLRQSAEMALDKAQGLEKQDRWPEARAVLEPMRGQLNGAGLEDLRRRVEQAAVDAALVERLEDIRLMRSTLVEGKYDERGADEAYATEFREAGLATEGEDAAAAADRLGRSAVRDALLAALDDWAQVTTDRQRRAWLLEAARRADPDPWRDRFRDPAVRGDRDRLEALAKELLSDEEQLTRRRQPLLAALAMALLDAKADASPLLRAAQSHYPDDFWLNFHLGFALGVRKQGGEAVGFCRAALAIRPSAAAAHNNLGGALRENHQLAEALEEYRRAIDLDPKYAQAHNNLGAALYDDHQLPEAIARFRRAIDLDPTLAGPHNNLGLALYDSHQPAEAMAEYRRAIDLDPKHAMPHYNLGNALRDNHQLAEAMTEYRRAIDLDPMYAGPHNNLGLALHGSHQLAEAIAEYRRAIEIDPKLAEAHNNLGVALSDNHQLAEAMEEFRRAIDLDPKDIQAHANLGNALTANHQLPEAIAEFHRAIDLDPTLAEAYCNLGIALWDAGRLVESRDAFRTGDRLGSARADWKYPSAQWVRQTEQLVEQDRKVSAVVEGKEQPADDAERLALARFCQQPYQKHYAASARFFADAFTHDVKLADNLQTGDRYNAACAAALAGCGQGADADKLADPERARWRKQAVDWLRADLVFWSKQAATDKPDVREGVRQVLKHWQEDADLSGLRDAAEVAKLPADEQEACKKLWADVQALLDKAAPKN